MKLTLDTRHKGLTGYPIKVCITIDSVNRYYPTNVYIEKAQWNGKKIKKSHPNHKLLNKKLKLILYRFEKRLLQMEFSGNVSHRGLTVKETLNDYGLDIIEELMKEGRDGTAKAYKKSVSVFVNRIGDLKLNKITTYHLNKFEKLSRKAGNNTNTISFYLRHVRAVLNKAIRDGLMVTNPFKGYKLKRIQTPDRNVSLPVLQRLFSHVPRNKEGKKWLNIMKLSFVLRGMNFVDIAYNKFDNPERVIYHRVKTKKLYSIGINKYSKPLIDAYLASDRVFNKPPTHDLLIAKRNYCNRSINRICINLDLPKITTYTMRYTWANLARDLGYSQEHISAGLGHSYGNLVTGVYLNPISNKVLDEMNLAICELVFGK